MKYFRYLLHKEDEEHQAENPVEELVAVEALSYSYKTGLMQVVTPSFQDIFFPISHGEYLDVLDAFKKYDFVEIKGYRGFNELDEDDFNYPIMSETLEDENKSLIMRVKDCNVLATFAVEGY